MVLFNNKLLADDIYNKRHPKPRTVITLREAEAVSNVHFATLSRIENFATPDVETLGKICKWLGTKPDRYFKL